MSLIFFLSVLIETIPSTSLAMPLLGKYIVFTLILITLSVCATVCVLNIHFRTPSTHSMPHWIKRWCMDILPKYLLMSVPQYQSQSSSILPEQLIYLHNQAYASFALNLGQQQQQQSSLTNNEQSASGYPLSEQDVKQKQRQQAENKLIGGNNDYKEQAIIMRSQTQSKQTNKDQEERGRQQTRAQMKQTQQINRLNQLMHQTTLSSDRSASSGPTASRKQNQLMELEVASLQAAANSASFLPYLQSEAARRLRMQRSRSSERDKSTSGEPPSGSNNNNNNNNNTNNSRPPSSASGRPQDGTSTSNRQQKRPDKSARVPEVVHSRLESGNGAERASNERPAHSKRRKSGFKVWNFLKLGSGKETTSVKWGQQSEGATRPTLSGAGDERQRQSNASAISVPHAFQQDDPDDDYQHHRHFQVRASICSNNLWRIGPKRRCSLAAPMLNYPTFYGPFVPAGHQHGANCGCPLGQAPTTISGYLDGRPAAPCRLPVPESGHENSASSESGHEGGPPHERAPSSNLQGPEASQQRQRLGGQRVGPMDPMTTIGLVVDSSRGQPSVQAMPQKRSMLVNGDQTFPDSEASSSQQDQDDAEDSSSTNLPPPPPPPLSPDFATRAPAPKNTLGHHHHQTYQVAPPLAHPLPLSVPRSTSHMEASLAEVRHSNIGHSMAAGRQEEQFYLRPNSSRPLARSKSNEQHLAQNLTPLSGFQQQQQRPVPMQDHCDLGSSAKLYQTAYKLQAPGQPSSIGRALGQAYIQTLRRQGTVYSPIMMEPLNQSLASREDNLRSSIEPAGHLSLDHHYHSQRPGGPNGVWMPQTASGMGPIPATIDMLRRSKSQSSLSKRSQPTHWSLMQSSSRDQHTSELQADKPIWWRPPIDVHQQARGSTMSRLPSSAAHQPRPQHSKYQRHQHQYHHHHHHQLERASNLPIGNARLIQRFHQNHPAGFSMERAETHNSQFIVRSVDSSSLKPESARHYQMGPARVLDGFGPGREVQQSHATSERGPIASDNSCSCTASLRKRPNNDYQHQQSIRARESGNHAKSIQTQAPDARLLNLLKLINEVDKAIQNAMFIAQHIDNLDEFESVSYQKDTHLAS